jgi:hypothetical protein
VITFWPEDSEIPLTLHEVVPLHVPLPPLSFDHVTAVTPTPSDAEPDKLRLELVVE